jgi:uncharacterized protein YqhQ
MSVFGGNALRKGVAFHSLDKSTIARRDENGNISIITKNVILSDQMRVLKRIPFIRGIAVLVETFLRTWKLNLIFIGAMTLIIILLENSNQSLFDFESAAITIEATVEKYFILIVLATGFIFTKLSGVSRYHGAEHKVFNTLKTNLPLTVESAKQQKRYAAECGTNLLVFIFVVFSILQLAGMMFYLSFFIGVSIGYEVFIANNNKIKRILTPFYFIGYIVQYIVFTSEPTDKQLEVALAAVRALEGKI